jgi:RimJ/RimL family protein N-acetyltransferase
MVTIRRIHLDEYERYKKIRIESLKEAPYAFSTRYKDAIKRSDKEWIEQANALALGSEKSAFFAFENRKAIGLCALYKNTTDKDACEIVQVWINPSWRGKGIAKDLLDNALMWAKENGFARIAAEVHYYNERAIRFFEKCGFARLAEQRNDCIELVYRC